MMRFSMAMADHAGLTRVEGPWQSYPERMLRMRARCETMREAFADVLRGRHLREEIEDYVGTRRAGVGQTALFLEYFEHAGMNGPRSAKWLMLETASS